MVQQGSNRHQSRDPTQKRRRNWFWHVSLARQVFAKLGPSQPERSSAANQRLCVRLAGTAQRIAGNLLQPTSFVPLTNELSEFCSRTPRPEDQEMELSWTTAARLGSASKKVSGLKPRFRRLQKFSALFD
jgi:hypothetical protein